MNVRARLLIFAIGVTALGCQSERSAPTQPAVLVEEAPVTVALDPAPTPSVDRSLGGGFEMRRPIVDGRLTIVPIIATRASGSSVQYLTLSEGLSSGIATLTEAGETLVVDSLRITNRSDRPLFALQGEVVIEGMQDRVIAQSEIVPPGESRLLTVRCVEHDRASGPLEFKTSHAIVELPLRRTLAHEEQSEVWGHVDAINQRLHLYPPTKTYRLAAAQQPANGVDARRAAIIEQLGKREERGRIVGYAVAVDGQIVALDRFATPELARTLEPMLLASYLANAAGPARTVRPAISPVDVQQFAATAGEHTDASLVILRERTDRERQATRLHEDAGEE